MAKYSTESIRAVALVGHGGAGKTTLAEALLFKAGAIAAKGAVEKGSTVCDFDAQEKSAGHSLYSALVNFAAEGVHVHLIDTPGYPDFAGQAVAALAGVETALVVINAQTGIELATERMMRAAEARGLARMIVINKIDADNVDLPGLVADIREAFGKQCLLLDLPAHGSKDVVEVLEHDSGDADFDSVAHAHRELIDQLVEEDESLLAQYLDDGQDPSAADLHAPFEKALRAGHLVPILFVSARTGAGIGELLHVLASLAPNPAEGNPPPFYRGEPGDVTEPFQAVPDGAKHVLAHVFKVVVDPYQGRVGVFRVHQGTMRKDSQLFVGDGKKPFKVAHLYQLQGKDYVEVDELLPGDIGAVAKVEEIEFDCVLHDSHDEDHIHLKPLEFPKPMQGLAVETKRKGDEQRLFDILHKLELEDPCFEVERHPTTHETVIRGLGEMHLRYKLEKMATQFKLELDTKPPQIPYRETITGQRRGPLPAQEAVGRRRPVRRGLSEDRAAGARRRLRVRGPRQGRGDPRRVHALGRKGRAPGAGRWRDRRISRSRICASSSMTARPTRSTARKSPSSPPGARPRWRPFAPPTRSCWNPSSASRSSRPRRHRRPHRRPVEPARPHHRHQPASRATRPRSPAKCRWPRSRTTPRA
jgi:elongation factor G